MSNDQFAMWLRTELEKRDWVAARLARESGITRGALSHIFSGERKPGLDLLRGVARALGLPLVDVLRAAGMVDPSQDPADDSMEAWVNLYRNADPETRQRLLGKARSVLEEQKKDQ